MNHPKKKSLTGEITAVNALDMGVTLVTVQDSTGDLQTISTSTAYWTKVGKNFAVGSIAKFEYEERIAGETQYTDSTGAEKTHTSSGNNIVGVVAFSPNEWRRMQLTDVRTSDISTVVSAEEENKVAIAAYLGQTFAAMK